MPILTTALGSGGPIIPLLIGVSKPREAALIAAHQAVPPPVQMRALIDTGASSTCIEAGSLTSLSLAPTGTVLITTPSTGQNPIQCSQYDVSLIFVHPNLPLVFPAMPIIECQPLGGNFQALLGRDFLRYCLFVYDGQAQHFALSF